MNRRRGISALAAASLILAISAAPVAANHTDGILDCGAAGSYAVQAASIEPLPKFEAPVPWSGLFLLEGTNRVFRAMSITTPRWSIVLEAAERNPLATVECTLTSSGLNFEAPWTLEGLLVP
jgi:hypothetical protein